MSFTRLEATDFVVSADSVTAPAWSTNNPVLSSFYTHSSAETVNTFYLDVYQNTYTNPSSSVQFSVAYGSAVGSGSVPFNNLIPDTTPSLVTYRQYRNLVYADPTKKFKIGGVEYEDVIVLSVDRNRYKESLFPGTFNLKLGGLGAPNTSLHLTDNSKDVTTITYLDCGRVFDIVTGSYGQIDSLNSSVAPYGMFLPDVGLIVLSPSRLGMTISLENTASLGNEKSFFEIVKSGIGIGGFQLNSQETISSNYVFVRVKNGEYNYTSNPSFVSGSGDLVYSNFINNPQTFPTTVGLYNDNSELLAVAKMSRPLPKDFTKEALIRVKLDW